MFDPLHEPGRVVVKELEDCWYWHAYVGELRVNGGICHNHAHGIIMGREAISRWRDAERRANYFWDTETCEWVPKSELQYPC